MAKKNARKKPDLSIRLGRFVGKHGPGAVKKLHRASRKSAVTFKDAAAKFSHAVMEGFKEV